ncbi:MAG TPA: hypothetical protein VN446_01680 [Candidatus Acidoferrum sp.]|nr:hypothetical protein [Candidatus Acidoferrum sp.]
MKNSVKPRLTAGTLMLVLAIAALVTFWYAKRTWIEPENDISPMPDSEFSDNKALSLPEGGQPLAYEELTPERFLALLAQYQVPAGIAWEVETTVYADSGSRTKVGNLQRTGDDYEVTLTEDGRVTRAVKRTGGTVTVDGATLPYSAAYTPLRQLGMADIEYLLRVDTSAIAEAGWAELEGRQVLYVKLVDPDLPQTESYWVSVELGLPLRCETYEGDKMTYLARTLSVEEREAG